MNVIYKTTNNINGKFYIGKQNTEDQFYLGSGIALVRAVKKYGKENFTKEILHTCKSKKETEILEASLVTQELVDDPNCYNMKLGGNGGSMKGWKKPPRGKEYKEKQRKSHLGKNNGRHKGMVKTPWGIYESFNLAAEAGPDTITGAYINLACQKNNNKPISYLSVCRSKGFLKKEHVGKTPKELGFELL
jgi:hypothetical protein